MLWTNIFAGFGGQGVLLIGQLLAYAGMYEGKNVSWLPSYGPEMRGGTANCSVVVSDEPVASPVINKCDCVIAMNRPSLDKFEQNVLPGGKLFINSSIIDKRQPAPISMFTTCPATKLQTSSTTPKLQTWQCSVRTLKQPRLFRPRVFLMHCSINWARRKLHSSPSMKKQSKQVLQASVNNSVSFRYFSS